MRVRIPGEIVRFKSYPDEVGSHTANDADQEAQ
jgi:hypothetical protein